MTRETKVGLVIGLGVILLVGIIVSEYFVRDDTLQEQPLAAGMPDFNNNTNQPAMHQRTADGQVVDPYARPGAPATAVEQVTEPLAASQAPSQPAARPGPRTGPPRIGADVALPGMAVGQRERQEHTTPADDHGAGAQGSPAPGEHAAVRPVRNPVPTRPGNGLATGTDMGNVVDTTQPIDPLPTAPPAPTMVEHVVAEHETLTQIARQFYNGDGNMWRSIRDANPDLVGPEGQVRAGVTLRIPMRSAETTVAEGSDTPRRSDAIHGLADNDRPETIRRGRRVEVKEGDTLSGIAVQHLGSANDWRLILDANPDVLTDANQLRPGMLLRIPATEEADVASLANTALQGQDTPERRTERREQAQPNPSPTGQTYTVVSGDSLYRIAEKTLGSGNRYHELFEANKDLIDSPDDIREGMVLRLPAPSQANAQ